MMRNETLTSCGRLVRRVLAAGSLLLALGCGNAASAPRGWAEHKAATPHAIQEVAPGRYRFEVRGQDRWQGDKAKAINRAELKSPLRHARGEDVWFSYQMRVRDGGSCAGRFCILGQFHQTSDPWDKGASPPFAINLHPGRNTLRFIKRHTADRTTGQPTTVVMYETGRVVPDRWMHVVGHLVFDWEGRGTVELWLDGRKIVDLPQTSIGYNDMAGPYWKFGIYRTQGAQPMVVEYANMELGRTPLTDRIRRPLPIR